MKMKKTKMFFIFLFKVQINRLKKLCTASKNKIFWDKTVTV